MKLLKSTLVSVLIVSILSCTNNQDTQTEKIISKPSLKMDIEKLTPELLWSLGRLGEIELSPDKKTIAFGVKYYDLSENKGNTEIYTIGTDGGAVKQITHSVLSEGNIQWRPDGKKIGFLYKDDSGVQMWEMNPDGTSRAKVTDISDGITGFLYSPDAKKILFTKELEIVPQVKDKYPDLAKANAIISEDLMYRHWDTWTKSYSHILVADYSGNIIKEGKDIMEGEKFDSPNKPFGGMEQIVWAPDSKSFVYTCVKKTGTAYSISTNSNLYQYTLVSDETICLTEGMEGYDRNPVFSSNGKFLAWESMERDGYESDKNRLFVLDMQTGSKKDYTQSFDQTAYSFEWDSVDENIYFLSDWHARVQICKLEISTGAITTLTEGDHNYLSVMVAGNQLLAKKMSISSPTELFSLNLDGKQEKQLTEINSDVFSKLKLGKVEERWIKTTDNKDMLVWVIYPPDFDSGKKYPAILYCQGGPQSAVSQFFSYRWNFQLMAANDYIIVAPNRRGLPGFGTEWNEQISGDYGGQNMKDYLSAIDAVAAEPYVDKGHLGAVGASYGGLSVYWLAGNHNKRFKAFIAHDGIFNFESMYLETEELWFVNWDIGGPYWEKDNLKAQKSYAFSPHKFVDNWDTPIMVIHGEKDYRVAYTQGVQAFTAAKLKGLPARYIHFPEENHWVLSPQNGLLWHREFFDWLDMWLKEGEK